jgi:YidC/Oxa1 family membrane protein insertase
MNDYKRMLLAVLIASLFIYLYTSVFVKPKRRMPQGGSAAVSDSLHPGAQTPPTSQAQPGGPQAEPGAPPEAQTSLPEGALGTGAQVSFHAATKGEREAEPALVVTQTCRGEILPVGGELASWTLEDFLDQNDEHVDLVNRGQGIGSDLDVEIVSEAGDIDFSDVPFEIRETAPGDPAVADVVKLTAADSAGASLTKTYTFYQDEYFFDLDIRASGFESGGGLACALSWRYGLPITESNERADLMNFAAVSLLGQELIKDKIKDFVKTPDKTHEGNVLWAGVRNKYFLAVMVPTHGQGKAVHTWGYPDRNLVGTQLLVPMAHDESGAATASFRVYVGPIEYDLLSALGVGLEKAVYQRFRFMAPLNHLILIVMTWTHKVLPNYGIVIILVSALTKLLFYPLTKSSLKSMSAMRKLQPEIEALKKKYKSDPKKMNQAQMELFRKHKVNPMGGCLPILVQMPIFFALYNVLSESVQLRRAPFVGWIDDLSAPDTLFHLGTFPIHVLPLVMAVTQLLQPQMGGGDPRQATMTKIMPVFLLVIFYGLPSGLVLYWTVNNVMTALQQYLMNRAEGATEAVEIVTPPKTKKGAGKTR